MRLRADFFVEDGCMRGSRKDGRRSAIASVGLYIAVIVGTMNVVARERWSRRGGGAREVNARSMQMRAKAEAAGRWVAADVVVNFGRPTHCRSTFQASPTQSPTFSRAVHFFDSRQSIRAPRWLRIRRAASRATCPTYSWLPQRYVRAFFTRLSFLDRNY